ncbi:MAG: lmo0937 family membrane protein [Saprospiraceae bacterium]|uniref:Lmo0937 family membrane protein n=1 Tax=Candidatus Opimibacter skivensis TaxID=2982028 RepID=A0A9D7T034_9BACT|nr:lmo0937 family membrane protein [Candidatus Opimibacter skivensis]
MGNLLYIIVVILILGWAFGYFGGYASGGLIHLLLVIAVIVLVVRLLQGRSAV